MVHPGTEGTSILKSPVPFRNVVFMKSLHSFFESDPDFSNSFKLMYFLRASYNLSIFCSSISIDTARDKSENFLKSTI